PGEPRREQHRAERHPFGGRDLVGRGERFRDRRPPRILDLSPGGGARGDRGRVVHLPPKGDGMSQRLARLLWVAFCAALFVALAYAYHRYVYSRPEPTISWVRHGITYQLLNPRLLGVILIAPWFIGVLGWTLADLPWQQRLLTVLFRIGFVAALAVGLARPVRSADTDKIATVYMVDVSDSVSDEALTDAQALIDEAFALKREDDLVRVVTFAKRPRLPESPLKNGDP